MADYLTIEECDRLDFKTALDIPMYFQCRHNYEQAYAWTYHFTKLGYKSAFTHMAFIFKNGSYVKKNKLEAIKWFKKAADAGDNMAERQMKYLQAEITSEDYAAGKAVYPIVERKAPPRDWMEIYKKDVEENEKRINAKLAALGIQTSDAKKSAARQPEVKKSVTNRTEIDRPMVKKTETKKPETRQPEIRKTEIKKPEIKRTEPTRTEIKKPSVQPVAQRQVKETPKRNLMDELINDSNGKISGYRDCLNKLEKYREELQRTYEENLPQLLQYAKENGKAHALSSKCIKNTIFLKTSGIIGLRGIGVTGLLTDGQKLYARREGDFPYPKPGDLVYKDAYDHTYALVEYPKEQLINRWVTFTSVYKKYDWDADSPSIFIDEMIDMLNRKIRNPVENIDYFDDAYRNMNAFFTKAPADVVKETLKKILNKIENETEVRV